MAMHPLVWHNRRIEPVTEARLSPGQSGLFNGWGLFTTMRVYDGAPFAFERHWNRLSIDADRIHMPLGHLAEEVGAAVAAMIAANDVRSGVVRVYLVRNKVGPWHSDEDMPEIDLLVCTSDLPAVPSMAAVTVRPHGRVAGHPLTGAKVMAWLSNTWMVGEAKRDGYDEVVLLNEHQEVAECTSANVFAVRDDCVETPPLSSGCLNGVTREVLLEVGPETGCPIAERPLTMPDLEVADEVFITSTSREILPVGRIGNHAVPRVPGPVTTRLSRAFSDYVRAYIIRAPGAAGTRGAAS